MKYITEEKALIKSWCNNPEDGAIEQARALANLPFIFKHVVLMPDAHEGYGMPIGGVIATKNVVIPNAVGVDIGCGMAAVKTSLKASSFSTNHLKNIMIRIRHAIPLGFKKHNEPQEMPEKLNSCSFVDTPICRKNYDNACMSLGTLGGGNHFIEIQKCEDDYVWIMVHSGSRNLGKQVCDFYNKVAIKLNEKFYNYTKDLAFLPIDSHEGQGYLREMRFALDFAKANRGLMVKRIKQSFGFLLDVKFQDTINIHHNYAAMEHHFGHNVMVHRKGATRARCDEIGIIPGSQGSSSYIVKGLGNPESFKSCSHGAGRLMSRTKARRNLNLLEEQQKLNDMGVLHSIRNEDDLDEACSAYKDIDVVMNEQSDLVQIMRKLTPLGVIKG